MEPIIRDNVAAVAIVAAMSVAFLFTMWRMTRNTPEDVRFGWRAVAVVTVLAVIGGLVVLFMGKYQ